MSHTATSYLDKKGLKSWLFTLDHKRIGVMYLATTTIFFIIAGIFALLMRIELMSPGKTITNPQTYNQWFTLHGVMMIFLFIIPVIPAALGNFFLPIMIGARDVAFPRLNLASYWVYVLGAFIALLSLIKGPGDTGWTFYTPYSINTPTNVIPLTLGAFVLGLSTIFTGLNFIVTVHKLRIPDMSWFKLPLFVWAIYATSIIQVIATPVIGITLLLLIIERVFQIGFFNPALGGDPILFQHFFWFYSHPAVYIMILPAMGIMSEVITAFSRRPIFGYKAIAFSSVAIAAISFLVWGHHMFVSGMSTAAAAIFSFLTFLVAIPTAIKIFSWVATLYKGRIWLQSPLLYALSFIFLFTIGGLTGLFLGNLATDVHLHDTYFVVAHFHYVMMGGTFVGFLAGLHMWFPKMFGRMYNEKVSKIAFWLIFIGFNLTFLNMFVLGLHGMPRRYYDYPSQFYTNHLLSTIGSWVLTLGLLTMLVNLLVALKRGEKAKDNPWGALGLEWTIPSPPPEHNFLELPKKAEEPYAYAKT